MIKKTVISFIVFIACCTHGNSQEIGALKQKIEEIKIKIADKEL